MLDFGYIGIKMSKLREKGQEFLTKLQEALEEKGERMISSQWINNQLFIMITNDGQLDGYTLYEDTNTVGGVNFIRTFGG
jgi:hypothetical protein